MYERGVRVVALMGLPGAGKSSVARELVLRAGLARVDRDRIREAMFPECTFGDEEKRAANQAVLAAVRANCALGRASVVDGICFSSRADLEAVRQSAQAEGSRLIPVHIDCPLELACRRVAADIGHPAGDRDPELVRNVHARFEPPPDDAVHVDGSRPLEQVYDAVLAAIGAAPRD